MLQAKIEDCGNLLIMHLQGRLFIESLNDVTKKWEGMVKKKPGTIAIDCAGLDSIDSSAIGTLVKFFNDAMSRNIELVCYDLNPSIKKLFYTIHLEKFFPVMSGQKFRKEYMKNVLQAVN